MSVETALIGISALVISALLTGVVRRLALAHGVLDVPNERSSHNAATPRAGGVSMVLAATTACLVLASLGTLPTNLVVASVGGGGAVAVIGFLDDRYEVLPASGSRCTSAPRSGRSSGSAGPWPCA